MSILILFCFFMLLKGFEVLSHLYRKDKDDYLKFFRKNYIIYDGDAFIKYQSMMYLVSGAMLSLTFIYNIYINNILSTLFYLALTFYTTHLIGEQFGGKVYKNRFN